jgi:hypothetical protein
MTGEALMIHISFLGLFLFLSLIPFCGAQTNNSSGESKGKISQGQNPSTAGDDSKKGLSPAGLITSGQNPVLSGTNSGEKFAKLVWDTVTKTNTFAKIVGDSLADYVKEEQLRSRQQELLDQFYISCREAMQPMNLSTQDARELLERVEQVYIEDGEKGLNRLDVRTFRDLPNVIRKEYGEMTLAKGREGTIATYYPGGALKTRWQYRSGKPEGSVVTYYENGEILYIDYYKNGDKISRRKYNPEGKLEFEQAYQYEPVLNENAMPPDSDKHKSGDSSVEESAVTEKKT